MKNITKQAADLFGLVETILYQWIGSRQSLFSTLSRLKAWVGLIGVGLASLCLPLAAQAAPLQAGGRITAPQACTYLPGNILDGSKTRFIGIETTGSYAILPTPNLPGGHWEVHGEYPNAAYASFQGYNPLTQVNGFLDGKDILSDPGSVNPWQPGQQYQPGSTFTIRVDYTPPALRQNPQPPGVMYMGYRDGPNGIGVGYSQLGGVMETIEGASGLFGGVPKPTATWVVDDPSKNIIRNKLQLCIAMWIDEQPLQILVAATEAIVMPTIDWQMRGLKKVFLPLIVDPFSGWDGDPYVNVFRPSPYGYSFPMFPAASNFVWSAPSPQYGKFYVFRFKAPTYSRVTEGIPNTGDEQTGYWTTCVDQAYSLIINSTGCLSAEHVHPDSQGYVNLVVSPADQRPIIDGKPYPDWLEHGGAGGAVFLQEFGANKATHPHSAFFAPTSLALNPNVWGWADTIQGARKRPELKQFMGEYYPQVYYCTKEKFEAGQCAPSKH